MIPRRGPNEPFEVHQEAMARWAGYDSADTLNRDHDPLHRALAAFLKVESYAMREAAGEALTYEQQMLAGMEEEAVCVVQRWMRHAGGKVPT